jgi:galactose mutarotase-like enzyme
MSQKILIKASNSEAEIYPALGGLCASLKISGRELLAWPDGFNPDKYLKISGGLALLFPICGRLSREGKLGQYLYDHRIFNLNIHGFLYAQQFKILDKTSPDKIVLSVRDTKETRVQYPFEFEIILIYQMIENGLICEQIYKNLGDKPMPFYAGFHPYFLINQDRSGSKLNFKAERSFQYNSQLTDVIGERNCLSMPVDLTDQSPEGYNERLSLLGSDKKVVLNFSDGAVLTQEASFNYLQLYTDFNKDFICLEPWMAPPNSFNSLLACPVLAPGESVQEVLKLRFEK